MTDTLEHTAKRIADRGRDALLARLRPAFADAASAHAEVLQIDDEQLEQMVQRAADRADGLQWRRALASVATEELGIGLGEALGHPAVERAQAIVGAPSYEDSLAELEARHDAPAVSDMRPQQAQARPAAPPTPPAPPSPAAPPSRPVPPSAPQQVRPAPPPQQARPVPPPQQARPVPPPQQARPAAAPQQPTRPASVPQQPQPAPAAAKPPEPTRVDVPVQPAAARPVQPNQPRPAQPTTQRPAQPAPTASRPPAPQAAPARPVSDDPLKPARPPQQSQPTQVRPASAVPAPKPPEEPTTRPATAAAEAQRRPTPVAAGAGAGAGAAAAAAAAPVAPTAAAPQKPQGTPAPQAAPAPTPPPTRAPDADTLRVAAVHLGGVTNLRPGESEIELRLSEHGLDIARESGEIIGRLGWDEIDGLEVPPSRGLLKRRRAPRAHLVVRAGQGDASFEIPAIYPDELREHLDPLLARHGLAAI